MSTNIKEDITKLANHRANKSNPHQVNKTQIVGLENVDNTSDANKPISTAGQNALDTKLNTSAVVNNLTTNDSTKVLSAAQGKALNDKITALQTRANNAFSKV